MTDQLIDLSDVGFWLLSAVAVVVMATCIRPHLRRTAWAGLNIGFLAFLLGWMALAVLLGVAVAFSALQGIRRLDLRRGLTFMTGLGLLVLFLLHKLPDLAQLAGLAPLSGILAAVGFSYVALRVVEVLRAVFERTHEPPDFASLVNYLLPFHMLAAGPIQSYDDFAAQPAVPEPLSRQGALSGADRIASGLFKKFVLAYLLRETLLTDFQSDGLFFFIEVQAFFLWLYLDFSAYSDIAVGLGRLMGVATPENFNRPYLARSPIDFWERWHISLSMFIRRNIFIPVQLALTRRTGGRRPLWCATAAFSLAFALCGLWHALSVNFLLWGMIHAAGLAVCNIYRFALKKHLGSKGFKAYLSNRWIRFVARVLTYEFVAFSLVVLFYP